MIQKNSLKILKYAFFGMLFLSYSFSQQKINGSAEVNKASAYFIKALEMKSKNQKDSAFFYYKLASIYDSKSLSLKKEILKLSLELKQNREALLQARDLVDSKEIFEENTWQQIALAYYNRTLTDSSIYYFKKSLDINPENPQVLWYLASAYEKIAAYKLMKDTYLKLIRLEDYPEELVKIHMNILTQNPDDSVDLHLFLDEIWIKKNNTAAGLWKVEKFLKNNYSDSADHILDTLIRLDSNNTQVLAYKILSLEKLQKNDSLLYYISKLYKIDTTNTNVLRALAKTEV